MKTPEVSIVIAAYNCGNFITETISSVINQTFQNWELIIVDDCSSDNTPKKIAAFNDNRISIIRLDKNSGQPATPRNIGIRAAKGKFIAFLDHDDIWTPEKLKIQVDFLRENPETALICCPLKIISPCKKYNNAKTTPKKKFQTGYMYDKLLKYNFIACSSVVIKVSVLDEVGFFDEDPNVSAAEDWDLWLRIARQHKITFIPQALGHYRMHGMGLSTETKQIKRILYVIEKHVKNGWVTTVLANKAKANFYFVEGWFIIDGNVKAAKEMFLNALKLNKANLKILFGSLFGLSLSFFPKLCKYIKNNYLDRKIKHLFNLEN